MSTINYTTKYSPLIADRFKLQSFTDKFAGKKFDFDGAQTVIVYTIDKVTLNDYNRTAPASRFGTVNELGDTKQSMTLTQDKAFTFSIDHGINSDQLNIKHCNEQLKSNWDEVCTPEIDKYRFENWCNGAGLGSTGAALTRENVVETVLGASAAMSNAFVPKRNRALFISESVYILTKLASEIVGIDTLGEAAVSNGVVGRLDGMDIIAVPDAYFPDGVSFLIKHTDSTVDPMKLKTLRVQKNPPGIDGDVGECRFYHDSFVLDSKINGLYLYSTGGAAAPSIALSGGTAKITCETAGATIMFTTDGSNPKSSDTAAVYDGPVTVEPGQTIRAFAMADGLVNSAVAQAI